MGQDLMKRLLLGMPLMALAVAVSGCSSSDIEVKSDVGEVSLVKESAVTPYLFDKKNAEEFSKKWINEWKKGFQECVQSKYLDEDDCSDYKKFAREHEEDLDLIKKMPDITLVKYRTIDTNVNGDKTASGNLESYLTTTSPGYPSAIQTETSAMPPQQLRHYATAVSNRRSR